MNFRFSITIFLLVVSTAIFAQTKVRVYGYVINTDNRGIELVNVYTENIAAGTSTNRNGYYDLNIEVKDSVTIVYSLVGYQTVRHTIFPGQKVVQISVEMVPLTKEIKDINVVAQRRQTSSVDYIDPGNYRVIPNTTGGIESLLITFTGVNQNNEFSSQYNVRGGNFDENIVYVNGIEVYRPLLIRAGQQEGLSFINPDMVKSVGFSAGGYDVKYGDKMSSVLDIAYKKPAGTEASVSLSLLGTSAYVATAGKRFTQMHGVRYKTAEYLLGTLDTKGEYKPSFVDYQTNLTYQLSPQWELSFLGNFSQNLFQFIPQVRQTNFGTFQTVRNLTIYYEGQEKDLFRTSFGALSLKHTPHKNLTLGFTASAFYTNENETYDILGEYVLSEVKTDATDPSEQTGASLGIGKYQEHARNRLKATVAQWQHTGDWKTDNHTLQWGAGIQYELIKDRISEWEWRDSAGYSLPYNDSRVDLYYNLKALSSMESVRGQAYIQDTYKWIFDRSLLSLTGGLRANYWTFNHELLVSPRVSVSFIPGWDKDFTFRLATGLYYQAPFYKEIRDTITDSFGNVGIELNNKIKAQRSLHFVVGGDYYFRAWGRPFKFTTEAYLKLADRVVSYSVDNVRVRYSGKNDAKAYTAGLDFKLFGELVPGTDSWINLSFMNSREDILNDSYIKKEYDDDGNVLSSERVYPGWMPRPNEQRYSFSMFFQDYIPNNPKYKVHLKFIWSDGLPFGAPRSVAYRAAFRAPAYRRVDIGASRVLVSGTDKMMEKNWLRHVKNIWLNLEVLNMLDFRNVNSYYWVTDISGNQLATPNYLSGRQFNFKLIVDFK
jgi:hypothetical protein